MRGRSIVAVSLLAALVAAGTVASWAQPPLASGPFWRDHAGKCTDCWAGPNPNWFIRQPDSTCKCVADTLVGPSVYCWNARKVEWRIRANSGTCSLMTVQVSNNDTTWQAVSGSVGVLNEFSVGDSLNTGGEMVTLFPIDAVPSTSISIPWRYTRLFVTRRTGYTTATASSGPTVACRTRADSIRWTAYVHFPEP